jgi:hypothetical protein
MYDSRNMIEDDKMVERQVTDTDKTCVCQKRCEDQSSCVSLCNGVTAP